MSIAEKYYVEKICGVQRELLVEKNKVCNNTMKYLHKGNEVHWGQSDTLSLDMIDKSTDMFIAHCDYNNKGGGVALIINKSKPQTDQNEYNFGNCCYRDKWTKSDDCYISLQATINTN